MKQVVQQLKTGTVTVRDVPPPRLRAGGALVATAASVISPGTERTKIELGQKSLVGKARARPDLARQVVQRARTEGLRETYRTVVQRLESQTPLGYSACGTAIEVADDCGGFAPGDLVACAGGGYANHAEINFVPKNLLARVPEGVQPAEAAYATIGAIAMHGVRRGEVGLGDRVVVLGLGLVGLLTVQIARAAGARVLGVDIDPRACVLAEEVGADIAVDRTAAVEAVAESFSAGDGVDTVLVCASAPSSDPVELAAELCRDRGRVVIVGAIGMTLPRPPFYEKELELRLSRSYGPGRYDPAYEEGGRDYPIGYVRWTEQRNMVEFLRLIGRGLVDVNSLTSHRFTVDEAPQAFRIISEGAPDAERALGVLLEYPGAVATAGRPSIQLRPRTTPPSGTVRVGVVGAGSFARRIILPALAADGRAEFAAVATTSGMTAREVADRFGFTAATSDVDELLEDPQTDTVVIATRHDSHARLTAAALRAGKTVFCEKPLATTWAALEEVAAAWANARGGLMVGFNRRFAPLVQSLRGSLARGVPRAIVYRINAGPLPAGHWARDPTSGGGRIVGELCHFLDLASYLVEGRPERVSAERLDANEPIELSDSVIVNVAFSCGSVSSIQYLGNGDPTVPKERLEVFCGGTAALLDDFRRLEVVRGGRRRVKRAKGAQKKGHREEFTAFLDLAMGRETTVMTAEDIFWSSALTLQVPAALSRGHALHVHLPRSLTEGPAAAF